MSTILLALAGTISLCEPFFDAETELYGFVDCNGKIAIPAKFVFAHQFTDGGIAAVCCDDDGWYYISRTGDFVIQTVTYDNTADYFSDGLARYVEDGKYGFFDTTGRIVIQAQYDFAFPFENGKAKIGENCQFLSDGEHTKVECDIWSFVEIPSSAPPAD